MSKSTITDLLCRRVYDGKYTKYQAHPTKYVELLCFRVLPGPVGDYLVYNLIVVQGLPLAANPPIELSTKQLNDWVEAGVSSHRN